ncbi:MAG: GNAT family N-acetyltransferase [Fidelibacterota bacterium]|nr:MAG: GNAT family N-acetyltransferase [Candidatus Neomarinimicrobiota bacterium]
MSDMLVKLYALPDLEVEVATQRSQGVEIRRAKAPERELVVGWVSRTFRERWGNQCSQTFGHLPPTCLIAVREKDILGFACYDAVFRGVFGPTGVAETERERGIGRALLIAALHTMREDGYIYGIVGRVGPVDFYARHAGAVVIKDSDPGMFTQLLR